MIESHGQNSALKSTVKSLPIALGNWSRHIDPCHNLAEIGFRTKIFLHFFDKQTSFGLFVCHFSLQCKWHENFIFLSESSLKVRKIAIYRFLISFLVPELLRLKDLKNDQKNGTKNARSWIKSIKIDKICDVM